MKLFSSKLLFVLFLLYTHSVIAQYDQNTSTIQGAFCSQENDSAAPGLMVSLVHPLLGRSTPAYTDEYGKFTMLNIPIRSDPYYIEVYWGKNLIYRNILSVTGSVTLPRICL
jgi:hypothetical protein